MSDFVRFGTHNMVLPPEGPKVYPNVLDFRSQSEIVLDFTHQVQQGFVSFIQSIYVDNSLNEEVLYVKADQTGQVVQFPSFSQGYMPMFITDSCVLTFSTTSAGNLTIPVVAANTPVHPFIWKVS